MADLTCWLPGCPVDPVTQWSRRDGVDVLTAVGACGDHTIALTAASRIHQPTCTADVTRLPGCGCTPEPVPAPVPPPAQDTVVLPTGWVVPIP